MINLPHDLFLQRTREELSRAQRYCLYLSLVVVDISDFVVAVDADKKTELRLSEATCSQLAAGLKSVVRCSDVVSGYEKCRIGLLLMEASGLGLERAVERIQTFAADFLDGRARRHREPKVRIYKASFPEEVTGFSQLASRFGADTQVVH